MNIQRPFALLLLTPALALAQSSPGVPGGPTGPGGRMGYSSPSNIPRSAGAPLAQPTYTPPSMPTPGSSAGYVTGAYTPNTYTPNSYTPNSYNSAAPSYKPVDGSYAGNFKPQYTPGSPGAPSYATPAQDTTGNPYVPSSLFSPGGIPQGSLLVPASPPSTINAAAGPAITPTKATLKPTDITAPTDENYTKALARFNEGQYAMAISLLEDPGRDSDSPLPTRKLYVAALVADNQLSMAAYQALAIARDYPLAFFGEPTLAATYQKNPELKIHLKSITDYARGNGGEMDTCILLALYNNLSGKGASPTEILATVKVPDEDKTWFAKLQSSLKPKKD